MCNVLPKNLRLLAWRWARQSLSARGTCSAGANRRGQALVEFAVVCLAVYLLLAAILTFGQLLYSAQGLQQAVDVAAREISRTPLPAAMTTSGGTMTLNYALYGNAAADPSLTSLRQQVFDDNLLVLSIDSVQSSSGGLTYNGGHLIGDFPVVTQQLMPLMINDQVNGQQLLRFPGAMFQSAQQGSTSPAGIAYSGYVVRIPLVGPPNASGGGQSIINWLYPLEPILDSNGADAFALNASTVSGLSGTVALRINYPYQSASMSGFVPPANPASPPGPPDNPLVPVLANNNGSSSAPPGVGSPVTFRLSIRPLRRRQRPGPAGGFRHHGKALPERDFPPGHLSPRGLPIASRPFGRPEKSMKYT